MPEKPCITIAIITCRRPQSLGHALQSLAQVILPQEASVKLLVVDNDAAGSAESMVHAMRSQLPFDVEYVIEKQRGIPHARNRVLQEAVKSDYIAFMDDDDVMDRQCINQLYTTQQRCRADVVSGAMEYGFEAGKEHLAALDIFAPSRAETGDALESAWTNNVLFSTRIYRDSGLRFDPAFAQTGGSDHHFFRSAHAEGARIVMCREAMVRTQVKGERSQLPWLARRHLRIGATLTMSERKRRGFAAAAKGAGAALADSGKYMFRLLPGGFKDRKRFLHPMMVACFMAGRVVGLCNLSPREYR